jgi:hypothetical protein
VDSSDSGLTNGSNNIVFNGVQIEANYYRGMELINSAKCRIVGSKFHGVLPTPTNYETLVIDSGFGNSITATNFNNCGVDHVLITRRCWDYPQG